MDNLLSQLERTGYCRINGFFTSDEIRSINSRIDDLIENDCNGVVRESGSQAIRGIHGPHLQDPSFSRFICRDEILALCTHHLEDDVYIHQYKINMKQAMEGRAWPWHQDFVYWREFDFIEQPRLLNIAVALDDITMLQGPLCFIPQSHKYGDLNNYQADPDAAWQRAVSSDLNFQIEKSSVSKLLDLFDADFITAKAGDVIFFDPQIAHCSSNNMSAKDRRLMIVTVNAVSNAPKKRSNRPEFLSAHEMEALRSTHRANAA